MRRGPDRGGDCRGHGRRQRRSRGPGIQDIAGDLDGTGCGRPVDRRRPGRVQSDLRPARCPFGCLLRNRRGPGHRHPHGRPVSASRRRVAAGGRPGRARDHGGRNHLRPLELAAPEHPARKPGGGALRRPDCEPLRASRRRALPGQRGRKRRRRAGAADRAVTAGSLGRGRRDRAHLARLVWLDRAVHGWQARRHRADGLHLPPGRAAGLIRRRDVDDGPLDGSPLQPRRPRHLRLAADRGDPRLRDPGRDAAHPTARGRPDRRRHLRCCPAGRRAAAAPPGPRAGGLGTVDLRDERAGRHDGLAGTSRGGVDDRRDGATHLLGGDEDRRHRHRGALRLQPDRSGAARQERPGVPAGDRRRADPGPDRAGVDRARRVRVVARVLDHSRPA